MPSNNRIRIACAGSGKTTRIAADACADDANRSALITYTRNGSSELREKVFICNGFIPIGMEVGTWFTFLLRHFVRPYQRALYDQAPIRKLAFMEGRSTRYKKKSDIQHFYFRSPGEIYSDKIAQFACAVIEATGGLPLRRIEGIYDQIFIDEVQDLAGYDLDLLEHLLATRVGVTMVGDVRQATYATNRSARNKKFFGPKIIEKFEQWHRAGKSKLEFETRSHRCVQDICTVADRFYPSLPSTQSENDLVTGHDGVFAVRHSDVSEYLETFAPQTLRLDRRTRNVPGCPINFGAAKGKTFERTLIFPHGKFLEVLRTGDVASLGDASSTVAKVYVAVTRARQSVGIVIPDGLSPVDIPIFSGAAD